MFASLTPTHTPPTHTQEIIETITEVRSELRKEGIAVDSVPRNPQVRRPCEQSRVSLLMMSVVHLSVMSIICCAADCRAGQGAVYPIRLCTMMCVCTCVCAHNAVQVRELEAAKGITVEQKEKEVVKAGSR